MKTNPFTPKKQHQISIAAVLFFVVMTVVVMYGSFASAATEEELRGQIESKNSEISELELQIQSYQKNLNAVTGQAQTLKQEVEGVNKIVQDLNTQISLAQKKIEKAELSIRKNEQELSRLAGGISSNRTALQELIQSVNEQDASTLLEFVLSEDTISSYFDHIRQSESVGDSIRSVIGEKKVASREILEAQQRLAKEKNDLRQLQDELSDKKAITEGAKKEKDNLLAKTKNQESQYRAYIADLEKRQAALDAEILAYESQLKFILDPKTLPTGGQGSLSWPLQNFLITQRFGKTVDSKRLYTSGSHSGVDFGVPVGTAVYAIADGIVEGVGDTDKTCPRTSFGKFVFIRHQNGTSAAYGHLSLQKVSEGQRVTRGQLIAYSGNTGYSTGPHLHLGLYASRGANGEEGVVMKVLPSKSCAGKSYRMPAGPTNSYLDPLAYLPVATKAMFKASAW